MKKIINNIVAIIAVAAILMMGNILSVCADETEITYSVEYADDSATLMFYITEIDAFDVGVIYDPSLLTVADCGYTKEFKMLQAGGENTTISVKNEDAKDDAGNTYVIFTGAGTNTSTGKPIDFSGKPLAYVTFEGNLADAHIKVVNDTAAESNVNEAELLGELTLNAQSGTVVTPEPVKDVVYISPEPTETKTDVQDSSDSPVKDSTSVIKDNSIVNSNETESEVGETESPSVTDAPQDTTKPQSEGDSTEDVKDDISEEKEAESSLNSVRLGVLIGVAVILIALVVIVVIKNRKK